MSSGVLNHLYIIFLYSLSLLLFFYNVVAFGYTNVTDRETLLAVKSQIVADPLGALDSWNSSIHFCRWRGVICGRQHQRVVSLSLSSLKLTGQLSPHIGNLTFLRDINLGNNTFHGTIPQEVGHLSRLRNLLLWNNSFEGAIPLNLTNCRELRLVLLIGNHLGGRIPVELGSLSRLEGLGLSINNFVGTIPSSLGNLSALSMLSLAYNHITGKLPFQLGKLKNLFFFQVSQNQLSGSIPEQLFNISSIQYFALGGNHLQGHLPANIGFTLPNLRQLDIAYNQLSGPIPPSLPNSSKLVTVNMYYNFLTGEVSEEIGNLQDLQELALGGNQLGSSNLNALGSIITSLTNCTKLLRLALEYNNIRGTLPQSVGNLSSLLTKLFLGGNPITKGIPSEIGNLASLQALGLEESMLSGHIPNSIGKLSKLQQFDLYNTKISGKIPSSIGNITHLEYLSLGGNLLQGLIPESLENCSHLEQLDLQWNQLNGEIPKKLLQLSSLTIGLNLARNNLIGQLSLEVSKLTNLNLMNFSDNKLSRRLPSSLESCQVLEILDISGNLFYGDIPYSLSKMRGIRILDASRNNFSGPIPYFLGELALTSLNLSYNNFEGEVPTSGVFKNASAFSVTGNVKLCGGIEELKLPKCLRNVSQNRRHLSHKLIIPLTVFLFTIFLVACCLLVKYQMRKSKNKPSSPTIFENKNLRLSYATLFYSTNGFSYANIIGRGRYGTVYKGILPDDEQVVAVKVLNLQERGANKTFTVECEALKAIRHRNLVKIITSCSSIDFQGNDFKALVFEFMPKGSLECWLHPSLEELQEPKKLHLNHRLDIATDVASALLYLHTECDSTMVHCDLKPSNILLDNDLRACVSDFGLTKSLSINKENFSDVQSSSTGVRGTIGYIAPEYGIGDGLSTSGDMYSFGVLLMELFTGKSPTENELIRNMSLHEYVKKALPLGVAEIVDPVILDEELIRYGQQERVRDCLVSIFQIGLACSSHSPRERMNIQQASKELRKTREMLLSCVFLQEMRSQV